MGPFRILWRSSMARKIKKRERSSVIFVFWEGESEQEYFKFVKQEFQEKANVIIHKQKGLFSKAVAAFQKNPKYKAISEEVSEIWFVFDTEVELRVKWEEYLKDIRWLRKLNHEIKVRLLMTKGCIEYFFLLHFEKCAPPIVLPSDKDKVQDRLKQYVPDYAKGDGNSILKIAERYEVVIENGEWSLLKVVGLNEIDLKNEDNKNKILFFKDSTFTNVHEVLKELSEK